MSSQRQENEIAAIAYRRVAREKVANGDWETAEWYLKRALHVAENTFAKFHGETGMVLIELSELYQRWERPLEKLRAERRIEEIVSTYVLSDAC